MRKKYLSLLLCFLAVQSFILAAAPRNIVICFHLYNLSLMDEFITRINRFMRINSQENFYIKIAVPVAENIDAYSCSIAQKDRDIVYALCRAQAPYHPDVVTPENCLKLDAIACYLKKNLKVEQDKLQIVFTENRGVDVGSFLLLMDQIVKQDLPHDALVKIHTKTHEKWRKKLLKILNVNLNYVLTKYECVYACERPLSLTHPDSDEQACSAWVFPYVQEILDYLNLPFPEEIRCSAGTMFIVSRRMTDFFKQHDLLGLYNKLNMGFPKERGCLLEHGLEVTFGHLFEYLKMRTLVLSHFLTDNIIYDFNMQACQL